MARKGRDQAPASSADTSVAPPDTPEDALGVRGHGEAPAPARARTSGSFDSEKASAAARARWAKRRAAESAPKDAPSATPGEVDRDRVIDALRRKAYEGDVPAARELREWLNRTDPATSSSASLLSLLTPEQRHIVDGWLSGEGESPA